jgi:tetratricopeptide (TPR) repeat protein
MKICKDCGAELKDSAMFCYSCGAPVRGSIDDPDFAERRDAYRRKTLKAERRSRRRRLTIFLFLVLFIVVIAGAGIYLSWSPAFIALKAVDRGDLTTAENAYENAVRGQSVEEFLILRASPYEADRLIKRFNEGNLAYADAEDAIALLQKFTVNAEAMKEKAETLKAVKASEDAWNSALSAESKKDYVTAMAEYAKVIESDLHYDDAKKRAQEMASGYKDQILEEAGSPETIQEYKYAIDVLEGAVKIMPDDQDFSEALMTMKQGYSALVKSEAMKVAKEYIEKGYYSQVIEMLDKALVYNTNDLQLQNLLAQATNKYEDFVKDQVTIYLDNKDWSGAMKLLERVRKDIPDDAVIEQLYETTKASESLYSTE